MQGQSRALQPNLGRDGSQSTLNTAKVHLLYPVTLGSRNIASQITVVARTATVGRVENKQRRVIAIRACRVEADASEFLSYHLVFIGWLRILTGSMLYTLL